MKISPRIKRRLRMQNSLFIVLFVTIIGLIAWLSTRYDYQADWTASGRHTLSAVSVDLLEQLEGPLQIQAFARDNEFTQLRQQITILIGRYQRIKPDIELEFIDPDVEPGRVREEGIGVDGELLLHYQGRKQHLQELSEKSLGQALQKLLRSGQQRILFVRGHGERTPQGQANHDLTLFTQQLEKNGLLVDTLSLTETPAIPEDTALLVIASPLTAYLPGEQRLIEEFIQAQRGHLLWLLEPDTLAGLGDLAESLGLKLHKGTIVDPSGQVLGLDNAAFSLVASYAPHPVSEKISSLTLFPLAAAMELEPSEGWQAIPLLQTATRSWVENGDLRKTVRQDADELAGPLNLGYLLTRAAVALESGDEQGEQRIAIIGDGDFLSNAYIGNGANLELGLNLLNWLSHDDQLLSIAPPTAIDSKLELGQNGLAFIGLIFLILLPFSLLIIGIMIWLKRRKQ